MQLAYSSQDRVHDIKVEFTVSLAYRWRRQRYHRAVRT
jgi:hypothetical protein